MVPQLSWRVLGSEDMTRRIALLGAAATAGWIVREKIELAFTVAKYSFMVYIVDVLPNGMRRRILSKEYSGEMLEKRLTQRIFKGFGTIQALWRMTSINLHPRVKVGEPIPATPVFSLDGKEVMLGALATQGRPLLINFGSCS